VKFCGSLPGNGDIGGSGPSVLNLRDEQFHPVVWSKFLSFFLNVACAALSSCGGDVVRPAASSNFEYGAALREFGLLGLVAMRVGKRLHMGRLSNEMPQRAWSRQIPGGILSFRLRSPLIISFRSNPRGLVSSAASPEKGVYYFWASRNASRSLSSSGV